MSDDASQGVFSMAPDGMEDYLYIHSAFVGAKDGDALLNLYDEMRNGNLSEVVVQISMWPEETVVGSTEEAEEDEIKESPPEENNEGKCPSPRYIPACIDSLFVLSGCRVCLAIELH